MPTRTTHDIIAEYHGVVRASQEDVDLANAKLDAALLQHHLEECEERFRDPSYDADDAALFEGGGSLALFEAVDACARAGAPLPQWAADAFSKGFQSVQLAEVATWDDAFGRPWPLRTVLPAKRRHFDMRTEIWVRVNELHRGGENIDEPLFERVGKEFDIKKSLCNRLYYQEKWRVEDDGLVTRLIDEIDAAT